MNTPLAGITVLDFGQIFQGPYATLLMAKAGANVIKIEPPHGEPGRRRAAPGKSTTLAGGDAERQQARDHAEPEVGTRPRRCCARWWSAPMCCWRISRPARWTNSASATRC